MFDAGLLMLRIHAGVEEFQPARSYTLDRAWVVENYGMPFAWPPNDFGYLGDDDDG